MRTEDPWSRLSKSKTHTIGQRWEGPHPLALYWAIDPDGSPGLVLKDVPRTSVPDALPKPRGLRIRVEQSEEPITKVSLFLQQPEDRDVFHKLCLDIIEHSTGGSDPSKAADRVFQRLKRWQALLGFARGKEMSEEEVRGLIAELWVLDSLVAPRLGLEGAIKGWAAPRQTPQDFALPGGLVEVKARMGGSRQQIRISSLEQLDAGPSRLHLVVVELTSADGDEETVSLNELVSSMLQRAGDISSDLEAVLQGALANRGYVVSSEYDRLIYRVTGNRAFEVLDTFPALRRSQIDPNVLDANYALALTAIGEFEREVEIVMTAVCLVGKDG